MSRAYARVEAGVVLRRCIERVAQYGISRRDLQIVDDRPHVQTRPADEHRSLPARFDIGDRGAGAHLRALHRPLFGRIGDVHEMMHDLGELGGRGFGGPDVEAAVHLHRVERHQLDVAREPRDLERQRRLARCGRADEREVSRQTTATGMRTRRRGAERTRRDHLAPQPVRRRGRDPGRDRDRRSRCRRRREVKQLVVAGAARPHRRVGLRRPVDEHFLDPTDARRVLRRARTSPPLP